MEENLDKNAPIAEFEGYVECPVFAGDCSITLDADGLSVTGVFDQLPVMYGEIRSITATDYRLTLDTVGGPLSFSRMGQELEWLKNKLLDAFNDAVAAVFSAKGELVLEAPCQYAAREADGSHGGEAVLRLYGDCLCILPPNENARRLSLSRINAMERRDYALAVQLVTGDMYAFSKMGREQEDLYRLLTEKLRALREDTREWHKELAPGLGSMAAAAAAKLMPLGRAAEAAKLKTTAPALCAALETKIKESRMGPVWPWLWELSGGSGLLLGALPPPEPKEGEESAAMALPLPGQVGEEESADGPPAEPPILWAVVPDRQRTLAAVELALGDDEAAATYVYRVEGSWENFSARVDQALEDTAFRREVFLLPEDKLTDPEHIQKAMLIRRSPAVRCLRRCFAGRAIHSSMDRWKRDLEKCSHSAQTSAPVARAKFCTGCGAKLTRDMKFCGRCGTKIG